MKTITEITKYEFTGDLKIEGMLGGYDERRTTLLSGVKNAEDTMVKNILRNILGREPQPEDAKELIMCFVDSGFDNCIVKWKGREVGKILRSFNQNQYKIIFESF